MSLPAPGPCLIDSFGDLQPVAANHSSSQVDSFTTPSPQNPLFHWWASQENPWDPIQGRNSSSSRTGPGPNYRHTAPAFSVYRGSHAPSDSDTVGHGHLPSDSGYESLSRPRHSVIGGSIYDDCERYGETASVSNGLAGLQFDQAMPLQEAWRQQAPIHAVDVPVSVSSEKKALMCPHCKAEVKTKSELKYATLFLFSLVT